MSQVVTAPTDTAFTFKRFYTGATYTEGELVKANNLFYKVSETHVGGENFDVTKFILTTPKLQNLSQFVVTADGKYLVVGSKCK